MIDGSQVCNAIVQYLYIVQREYVSLDPWIKLAGSLPIALGFRGGGGWVVRLRTVFHYLLVSPDPLKKSRWSLSPPLSEIARTISGPKCF